MGLSSCSAIICFSLLLLCHNYDVNGQQVWELNSSYTLTQPNLTQKAWQLENYPDSLAFLILAGPVSDVLTYLCLLSSPTPSPVTTSIQEMSFTLSIYMYLDTVVNRGAIVWTANGLHPVSGSLISLCLRSDGNLVLFGDDPSTLFWSSNTAHKGVTTMGVIQYPTVSLVLCNSSGGVIWQSADYPTDTLTSNQYLLPGHKLTSWASSSDASPGGYSLVVEPSGLALYMGLQEPEPYWIWSYYGFNDTLSVKHTCEPSLLATFLDPQGALLLQTQFPGAPLDVGSSYWPQFCSSQRGYHTSGTLPFKQYATGESVPLRNSTFLHLEHDGNLRAYSLGPVWSPQLDIFESDACRLPNYCGSYGVCTSGSQCACPANGSSFVFVDPSNFSLGCSPKSELHCNASSQKDQTMLQLSGVDHVANNYTPPLNSSTEEACIGQCAQSCSCLVAFWNRGTNACHHADEARSLQGSLDKSIFFTYVKVTAIPQADAKSSTTIIIFASVVSGVFA
ncbi:hypothetical protein L7F22_051896 [Adiantum nelumboides]|nr:hypothetical protein [Adiantum nelumboides]